MKLRSGGEEKRVTRYAGAGHREAGAERLEHRERRRVVRELMRPGHPPAQQQDRRVG